MANLWKKTLMLLQSRFEKEEEKEEGKEPKCNWESLPENILGELICKLNLRDAISMSMVCKSGRLALQNNVHDILTVPWMMLPYEWKTNCVRFFDLCDGCLYKFNLPKKLKGANWFCGSSKGWLIMANGPRINPLSFLFNPISGVQIQLPPFTTIPSFHTYLSELEAPHDIEGFFSKFELSSVEPTKGIVSGILFSHDKLAICRPNDKSWTIWESDTGNFQDNLFPGTGKFGDILFSNGIFHVLTYTELHYLQTETHTVRVGNEDVIIKKLSVIYPENINVMGENDAIELEFGWTWVGGGFVPYLVEAKGECLLVQKMYNILDTLIDDDGYDDSIHQFKYNSTREFHVLKIGHPTITSIDITRLNSFNDQILFVSKDSSYIRDRKLNGLEGNCIFFLDENGHSYVKDGTEGDGVGEKLQYCESHQSRESGIFYFKDKKILRAFPSLRNLPRSQMCWFLPNI